MKKGGHSMASFNNIFKQDYDKKIKVGDEYAFCYSPKKLKELYPEGNYSISGEARNGSKENQNKYDEKQLKKLQKMKEQGLVAEGTETLKIGDLRVGNTSMSVYPSGSSDKLLDKIGGYICIGDGKFVALHESRVPFLITVSSAVAATAVVIAIIIGILANPTPPIVIDPDHPLPDPDPNVTPIEDEDEEQMTSEEGGGAVSMIYTMEADYTLGSDWVEIYFRNPKRSNHDVTIELYVVSEGTEYLLGTSGRVAAGHALYRVTVSQDAPELSKGVYTGLYRIRYYNSLTGEKALVESDIEDIQITVTQ